MCRLQFYYHYLLKSTQKLSKGSFRRSIILFSSLMLAIALQGNARQPEEPIKFFPANHPYIQYIGRIDFTNPELPRFWQPGVYITVKFEGSFCDIILKDEELWGKNHNYLQIIIDGKADRIQTKAKIDTIRAGENLLEGIHTLVICKNTEANSGYLELVGIRCAKLIKPQLKPTRKIEFIGNSITCGTGNDQSAIACGKGVWHDQHNAYFSYGPIVARSLKAQYHLSAVSGIGLMHSCCSMNVIMPQVFDKVSMRNDTITWDFKNYQPDVVTICLGQNDGIQDPAIFVDNYVRFLDQLRKYYPHSTFVCLTSPMADVELKDYMQKVLKAVIKVQHKKGDYKVNFYAFSKRYHSGCDDHPNITEHKLIASELGSFVKRIMKW